MEPEDDSGMLVVSLLRLTACRQGATQFGVCGCGPFFSQSCAAFFVISDIFFERLLVSYHLAWLLMGSKGRKIV